MEGSWQQMAGSLYAMYERSIETVKKHFHSRTEFWCGMPYERFLMSWCTEYYIIIIPFLTKNQNVNLREHVG